MKIKPWQTKWQLAEDQIWQRSGGQGKLRLVKQITTTDHSICVLKELKNQSTPERRQRMRREVVSLETIPHESTSKLLDHNTQDYNVPNIDLYAVFEFIPGLTLTEYISKQGPMELNTAITLTVKLLETLKVFHTAGIGHRDIKPDNIILRNDAPSDPVLIDFGLSYNLDTPSSLDTPDWQQVGNRFLTLPEHASFSASKRDLRSDITSSIGILFYALTNLHPATLSDTNGVLPHQRDGARQLLSTLPERQKFSLLHLFDVGFSYISAHRWQSIEAVMNHLSRITDQEMNDDQTSISIAEIQAHAEAKKGNLIIREALDHVRLRIRNAAYSTVKRLGSGFEPSIEEKLTTMDTMSTWIRCGVSHAFNGAMTNTFFNILAVGDELVVSRQDNSRTVEPDVVARLPIEDSNAVPELTDIIYQSIIKNVHKSTLGEDSYNTSII